MSEIQKGLSKDTPKQMTWSGRTKDKLYQKVDQILKINNGNKEQ